MAPSAEGRLAIDLAHALVPLKGGVSDDETLFGMIGDASVVLIGESTHGTHEFYRARADITRRLIDRRGFTAVCIEGDWPDAYRVNRYVRGASDDADALESFDGFKRFPTWMWRNAEVLDFIAWLREYNDAAPARRRPKAGFYGLDLYGMYAAHAVMPVADTDCRDRLVAELLDIARRASHYAPIDERVPVDQYFYAQQSARVAGNAQEYYRAMLDESPCARNLRDAHMFDTLERLMEHLAIAQGPTKIVVWTHNETNVAAFARRRFGPQAVVVGLTTYGGTVTAASQWHAPHERKRIVPARGDSYEYLFHATNVPRFLVPLRSHRPKLAGLPQQARERVIGVVYQPQTEPESHYFTARLIDQFDALYHFDVTRALEPL